MSRLSVADDRKISSDEGQLFADSICSNMDKEDVIEQWMDSLLFSSGSVYEGRVDCVLNSGMVLVKIDDHTTQIKITIVTTFLINSEIEFPLNVTLTQQPLPTEGSIAWLAPAHPMSITLSGDNGVSDSVPLWWNDDSNSAKLSNIIGGYGYESVFSTRRFLVKKFINSLKYSKSNLSISKV